MDILNAALSQFGPEMLKNFAPQIQNLLGQFIAKPEAKAKIQALLTQFNIPIPAEQILAWLGSQGMVEEKGDQIKGTPALTDLAAKLPELLGGLKGGGLEGLAKTLGGSKGGADLLKGLFS